MYVAWAHRRWRWVVERSSGGISIGQESVSRPESKPSPCEGARSCQEQGQSDGISSSAHRTGGFGRSFRFQRLKTSTTNHGNLCPVVILCCLSCRGATAEVPAPIDSVVMRRKRAGRIQEEQAAVRERLEHYRPPYIKPVGEKEKSR